MDTGALIERLNILEAKVDRLTKENKELRRENKRLKERLAKYENPKNSRNSSIPPSKDENRPKPNQSLRKPTGKKPGGQAGRKGKTLRKRQNPDKIIEISPDYCNCCGASLKGIGQEEVKSRQIIDIPVPKPICTEFRIYAKTCKCGHTTRSDFPENVNTPVGYGPNIEGLIGYYHARH